MVRQLGGALQLISESVGKDREMTWPTGLIVLRLFGKKGHYRRQYLLFRRRPVY